MRRNIISITVAIFYIISIKRIQKQKKIVQNCGVWRYHKMFETIIIISDRSNQT